MTFPFSFSSSLRKEKTSTVRKTRKKWPTRRPPPPSAPSSSTRAPRRRPHRRWAVAPISRPNRAAYPPRPRRVVRKCRRSFVPQTHHPPISGAGCGRGRAARIDLPQGRPGPRYCCLVHRTPRPVTFSLVHFPSVPSYLVLLFVHVSTIKDETTRHDKNR